MRSRSCAHSYARTLAYTRIRTTYVGVRACALAGMHARAQTYAQAGTRMLARAHAHARLGAALVHDDTLCT
eukprot:3882472-Pleurochrysis_carterae.AAC.4